MKAIFFCVIFAIISFLFVTSADATQTEVLLSPSSTVISASGMNRKSVHKLTHGRFNLQTIPATVSAGIEGQSSSSSTIPTSIGIKTSVSENFYPSTKLSPDMTRLLSIIAFTIFVLGMLLLKGNLLWLMIKKLFYRAESTRYTQTILLQI